MKYLFILFLSLYLCSCKKEEVVTEDCTCGVIANDGVDYNPTCYWLEVRNNCSGNKKKFCFDQDIWMQSGVGEDFCVYNVQPW